VNSAWRRRTCATEDSGSGTVYVLMVIVLLLAVLAAALMLGQTLVARHQAASAADLAALAAADRALEGSAAACAVAAAIASAQEARITACRLHGEIVEIDAAVSLPAALSRFGPAKARARAGPADSPIGSPDANGEEGDAG
jgi:secretion/DNA translocation related TadE-like protein